MRHPARREQAENKPPKAYREIFQILKDLGLAVFVACVGLSAGPDAISLIREAMQPHISQPPGDPLRPELTFRVTIPQPGRYAIWAQVKLGDDDFPPLRTLHRILNDLVGAWEDGGVREFILLTAHEHDPHLEALSTVVTREARIRSVDVFGIDFSAILEGQGEPMHGDEVDTSLMMYLAPDLVRLELAQDYMLSREELRRYRRGWLRVPPQSSGSIGRPRLATAEKGAAIYDRIRSRIAERIFLHPAPDDA